MQKIFLTLVILFNSSLAISKEYIVKEISDPAGKKPYYFEPNKLTIQLGDTVTFVNSQDDMHDVMFYSVPKDVKEMIMSPLLQKEGDKWSYKFSVPGTYQYHCHPHESLGMKGTIIVGTASKIGGTKKVDHHMLVKKTDAISTFAQATGKINNIDVAKHTINITHDPIKTLGWPKMRMEFAVDPTIDLSAFKAEDEVSFSLKPSANEEYTVVNLKKK